MQVDNISGEQIASNIRAERHRVHLSQKDVAEQLDITLRTYNSYETDASAVKVQLLYRLAKIFNCKISAFYLISNSTDCGVVDEDV